MVAAVRKIKQKQCIRTLNSRDIMVNIPEQPDPGRNDPCPCGSKKKYKKCCLKKKEFSNAKIDLTTMLKLLYCVIGGLDGKAVMVTKRTVDEYCKGKEWMEKLEINAGIYNNVECYRISIKPDDLPKIIQPSSNIILPPGHN